MWDVAFEHLGADSSLSWRKAGRQRGGSGTAGRGAPRTPQDGTSSRVLGRFPPATKPAPSKGNLVPRRPRPRAFGFARSGRGKHREPHAKQEPTSSGYPRLRCRGGEKMAKTKLSPPTRKANHTPCIPQPSRPGPAPAVLSPGPREVRGHGREWE